MATETEVLRAKADFDRAQFQLDATTRGTPEHRAALTNRTRLGKIWSDLETELIVANRNRKMMAEATGAEAVVMEVATGDMARMNSLLDGGGGGGGVGGFGLPGLPPITTENSPIFGGINPIYLLGGFAMFVGYLAYVRR